MVPLGVSDYTTEPDMRPHTLAEARRVLDVVDEWQARFARVLGRRLVYASDEYYLLAERPFPALDTYDELAQLENGIGLAVTFSRDVRVALDDHRAGRVPASEPMHDAGGDKTGFFQWVDGAPAEGYRAPRTSIPVVASIPFGASIRRRACDNRGSGPCLLVTGVMGERVLAPLLPELTAAAGAPVDTLVVANQFFGGNIGVTGLLTGADIARALDRLSGGPSRVLLPDVVLSNGRFLDGMSVDELPRSVEIVPSDGAALVAALTGSPGKNRCA